MQNASPTLLCLLGSPRRKGNTDLLAAEVCRGFESSSPRHRVEHSPAVCTPLRWPKATFCDSPMCSSGRESWV